MRIQQKVALYEKMESSMEGKVRKQSSVFIS